MNQLGYICIFVRVPELAVRCQRYTSYTTGQQDRDLVQYQEIEGGSKREEEEVIFCKYVLQLGFAFFPLSESKKPRVHACSDKERNYWRLIYCRWNVARRPTWLLLLTLKQTIFILLKE